MSEPESTDPGPSFPENRFDSIEAHLAEIAASQASLARKLVRGIGQLDQSLMAGQAETHRAHQEIRELSESLAALREALKVRVRPIFPFAFAFVSGILSGVFLGRIFGH